MSLLHRPIEGQIIVNYSDVRKKELQFHDKISCNALTTLLKLTIEKNHLKVNKIEKEPTNIADLKISFIGNNEEDVKHLGEQVKLLLEKRIGAKEIDIFLGKN